MDTSPTPLAQFTALARLPDEELDLARAALLIAAVEHPDVDVERGLGVLDALASPLARRLGPATGDDALFRLNSLSQYLVDDLGFRGNTEDYYDPRNSCLNDVLQRRAGIPITLSLVYVEVGKRCAVPLVGVGMPGHFLVRHRDVPDLFCDPFHGGILLSADECAARFRDVTRGAMPWSAQHLATVGNRDFVARVLRNLKGVYLQRDDLARALGVMDRLVALLPGMPAERRDRGVTRYRAGWLEGAAEDLRAYLAAAPRAPDADAVREMLAELEGA